MWTQHSETSIQLVIDPDTDAVQRLAAVPAAGETVELWTDPTGHCHAFCVQDGDWYRIRVYGAGSFAFTHGSGLVRGAREPGVEPDVFNDIFRRQLLPFILQRQCWEVLHASGLVVEGVCIALCGDSLMGKSTLAHAWNRRGGRVFADDAVPFRIEGRRVVLRPIPFQLRLRPLTLDHYGPTDAASSARAAAAPVAIADEALGAIYLLDRRGDEDGPVELELAEPAEALRGLLKQAYCLTLRDRVRNQQMMETYLTLMSLVPIYRLSYPTGLRHAEVALDRIAAHMADLGGEPAPEAGIEQ